MKTNKLIALTVLTLITFGLTGCKVNNDQLDELPPKAGVFAENLNEKGEVQPQLTDRVQEKVDEYVNEETINEAIGKTKEVINKENAEKVVDKAKELNGSEQAKEIKDKVSSGIGSLFGKAKAKVNEFLSDDSQNVTLSADEQETYNTLSEMNFNSGDNAVVTVNNNQSTLNAADWTESHVTYSNLDNLNRAGVATAYLNQTNVGASEGRGSQSWQPTGWKNQSKRVNGKKVTPFDRGHLIAYTLTFNLDDDGNYSSGHDGSENNPKNLVTQTSYSNRSLFQKYEGIVRDELKTGGKVIYRVQPVFRGDEKLARGFWLQAISLDGDVNFNVYIFNVMDNFVFDYSDGSSTVDTNMDVK